MRKILLVLLPVVLAVVVFVIVTFVLFKQANAKGALQVTSIPQSSVYLNGKLLGKTPLCKCDGNEMLASGDYTIRLVPTNTTDQPYEEKISINPSVLTVVDRTFGDIGKSSGSIISLTPLKNSKTAQLFVASFPYGASITVDSNPAGITPVLIPAITESDHEVIISKDGYASKTIRIHGVFGYKLSAIVTLPTDLSTTPASTSATTTVPLASPSAALQGPQVVILDTPTGFLRVRDAAGLGGAEIAQVHPGETYQLISEQNGWYQIQLSSGKSGWISSSYAKKK